VGLSLTAPLFEASLSRAFLLLIFFSLVLDSKDKLTYFESVRHSGNFDIFGRSNARYFWHGEVELGIFDS